MRRTLAPSGTRLFSNIATGNPLRPWIEYLGDWTRIERDDDDLERMVTLAEFPADAAGFSATARALALMASMKRSLSHTG